MRNAVIPYAIIAIVGIIAVIVIALVGANQRADMAEQDENGQEETGEIMEDPEEIYELNCTQCHGADLSGGMGPDLTSVGANLSVEEIKEIILQGRGTMPPQDLVDEEAQIISDWLGEKQ